MSASRWKTEAAKIIAGALKSLPPGSDEKTKRKAIRAAYPWGERKRWPYKCWCDVARDALLIARPTSGPKKRGRRKPVAGFMPAQRDWALANGLAYDVPPEPEPELAL